MKVRQTEVELNRFHKLIVSLLPESPEDSKRSIWISNKGMDGEILCKSEAVADAIADFLEELGFDEVTTGYYDPEEDERSGEVDRLTGWHYVSF